MWTSISWFTISFLPLLVLEKNFGNKWHRFLWAVTQAVTQSCQSCHPSSSVKALKSKVLIPTSCSISFNYIFYFIRLSYDPTGMQVWLKKITNDVMIMINYYCYYYYYYNHLTASFPGQPG